MYLEGGGGECNVLWGAMFISSLESVSTWLSLSLKSPFIYGGASSIMCSVDCSGMTSGGILLIWMSPFSLSVVPLCWFVTPEPLWTDLEISSSSEPVERPKLKNRLKIKRGTPWQSRVRSLSFFVLSQSLFAKALFANALAEMRTLPNFKRKGGLQAV